MKSSPLLNVDGVGVTIGGSSILRDVSFDVESGECVAVMGRNGAGKSTLLDVVAGLRVPGDGAVRIDGSRLSRWTPLARARAIAHLPQQARADLAMSAEALVLMGRYAHAETWFESAAEVDVARDAMARTGCLALAPRMLHTLSGGERQRVLLAACLAQRPRLLLLDEPATFLDVDQQLQCFDMLRAEARRGVACVAVTHDVNLALTFCSRLIVLEGGALAHDIPASAALDSPGWLQRFSSRLIVERSAGTTGWVRYE